MTDPGANQPIIPMSVYKREPFVPRPIKFRAWDGEKMVWPASFNFNDQTAYWKENSMYAQSKTVMQFTGLVDKHGVEIYEGDIIRVHDVLAGEQRIKEVKWYSEFTYSGWNIAKSYEPECEVIGNVHENPELMIK